MTKLAIFSYITDRRTWAGVPIGVVVWSPEKKEHAVHFAKEDEDIPGLPVEYKCYLALNKENLEAWATKGKLPYLEEEAYPYEDKWWIHVKKLLNHAIRLSDPIEFDEALFQSVVSFPKATNG